MFLTLHKFMIRPHETVMSRMRGFRQARRIALGILDNPGFNALVVHV